MIETTTNKTSTTNKMDEGHDSQTRPVRWKYKQLSSLTYLQLRDVIPLAYTFGHAVYVFLWLQASLKGINRL